MPRSPKVCPRNRVQYTVSTHVRDLVQSLANVLGIIVSALVIRGTLAGFPAYLDNVELTTTHVMVISAAFGLFGAAQLCSLAVRIFERVVLVPRRAKEARFKELASDIRKLIQGVQRALPSTQRRRLAGLSIALGARLRVLGIDLRQAKRTIDDLEALADMAERGELQEARQRFPPKHTDGGN